MNLAIKDGVHQLKRHKGILSVSEPVEVEGGSVSVEIEIEVALPSRAKATGISKTGVRDKEICIVVFGSNWPMNAPKIWLRKDFPLNLPHINPHTPGQHVSPCISEGPLSELLHRFGLDAVIDQLIDWLGKAASGTLINLEHGWEPTRRDDSVHSFIVCSAEKLVAEVPKDGTFLSGVCNYLTSEGGLYTVLPFPLEQLGEAVFAQDHHGPTWSTGKTAVFIARAAESHTLSHIIGVYQPETVVDFESLLARANQLNIDSQALRQLLDDFYVASVFDRHQDSANWKHGLYAVVILMAQRPVSLIGSPGRNVEILPYIVRYEINAKEQLVKNASAHPAFHSHALSQELLARASGVDLVAAAQQLVFMGCGSLGSKIALHLGRAGYGAATLIDNKILSPHNVARHALIDPPNGLITAKKVDLMKDVFEALTHTNVKALDADVASLILNSEEFKAQISPQANLIIDTTASLRVFSAESQSSVLNEIDGRLVRISMYGQGGCVALLLEGHKRSARVDDLTAMLFERCRHNESLRFAMAGNTSEPTTISVGDSCSSVTTVMSDSYISRSASIASIQVERWLENGVPVNAMVCVGFTGENGIEMNWESTQVNAFCLLDVGDDGGWKIRISKQVSDYIDTDVEKWTGIETGGALIGRVSLHNRTISIVGVVDAPPDSIREKTKFILGTQNLVNDLRLANQNSLGYLCFIGTWHSHPMGGGHSDVDFKSLRMISEDYRGLPAVSLVWTPEGLKCAVARW
ncbi:MAG: thiamine biosynthesis protein ThiF [Methylotenera sp.]|nr:MAG: thiamine biosynthesis protein ThiF [Methylotenera sp.]